MFYISVVHSSKNRVTQIFKVVEMIESETNEKFSMIRREIKCLELVGKEEERN